MEIIPTLVELKVTVTSMKSGDNNSIGKYRMQLYVKDEMTFK